MLKGRGLPNSFWIEAVCILNHSYTKALKGKTPLEAYSGKKPSIAHFRVFGCECYAHVPDQTRTKLEAKSRKCIFLGYSLESKAYRLYDSEEKKVIFSCDVVLLEQPHALENMKFSMLLPEEGITNQVTYNPKKDEEEEDYSINKTPQSQQPTLAPDRRTLPKMGKATP